MGRIGELIVKVTLMDPAGLCWALCFRTHHEITMYLPGKWGSAPSVSLAPYYAAQMRRCTQKWDRRDEQGASSEAINVSRQLIGVVGTGLYHSMAEVQATVRSNCGSDYLIH